MTDDQRFRSDKLSPEQNAQRLARIHAKTERMTYGLDDSRIDYDDPQFRDVSPDGWTRRRG